MCGVCECDSLYYGSKCECSKLDSTESNKGSTGNISSCIKYTDILNFLKKLKIISSYL